MTDEEMTDRAALALQIDAAHAIGSRDMRVKAQPLVNKALKLVDLLDDAERNHGSLVGTVTMRARDELRIELLKWK